jgi:hypothetical protein
MHHKNEASVFPEPVGAAISVDSPAAMERQPLYWGGVGSRKRSANQPQTIG